MGYEFLIGSFFIFCAFFVWLIILAANVLKNREKINTLQDDVKKMYEFLQKQANLIHKQNEIMLNKDDEIIYFDEMTLKKNTTKKPHQSHTQKRDSKGRFTK